MCFCAYLALSAVGPETWHDCSLGNAESGSECGPEPRKNTRLYDRSAKGLDSTAQKINLYKKPDHEKPDRHWMLLKWKKRRPRSNVKLTGYSSAHAVRDLNSAAARRIKTTSRVYHLAGIGKCRNSLKTRCAALRLQLKIVFPSRSSACCFTCVRCEVIALPRNRMIYILVSLDALKRHSSPPKICGETSKVAHVCVVYAVNPVTSCGADTIDAARRAR